MLIHILCIAVLLVLLEWQQQNIMIDRKLKKYSMSCIMLTLIVVLAETGCSLVDNTIPENRVWSVLCNIIGFGVSPFVFLVESNFYYLKQTTKKYWIYLPATLHLILVCISPLTGWIFYVDENCRYSRGNLFFLYLTVFTFSIMVSMVQKIKAIQNYPRYFRTRIISSTILMLAGLIVQILYPEYVFSWMVISVYLVLYYAHSCEANGMIDGLTGLLNRTAFNKIINNFKRQKNKQYYLFMLDANNFKTINDTKGHTYGDFCLSEIAVLLLDVFSKNAHVFRYGGDEFCVFLTENQNADIENYITQIRNQTAEKQKNYEIFPEIAVGYEKIAEGTEIQKIVELADEKMYKNKQEMKK